MEEQPKGLKFLQGIPGVLASNVSIFIFIFLFVYLVIFGVLGLFVDWLAPSEGAQLVLGNYTNVTSALGAAIAAGASTQRLSETRKLHHSHEELRGLVEGLHRKVDKMSHDKPGEAPDCNK